MNEMNQLEEWLRTWTPRRPSRNLEWRLRNHRAAAHTRAPRGQTAANQERAEDDAGWRAFSWPTLTRVALPSLACLYLTAALLTHSGTVLVLPNADPAAIAALALSNQNFAPYLPGSYQPTANRWDNFGWTNGNDSPPSMRSLTPREANH